MRRVMNAWTRIRLVKKEKSMLSLGRNRLSSQYDVGPDLVGLGVSTHSRFRHCLVQNESNLSSYYRKLDCNELPIARGIHLDLDDRVRREIVQMLIEQQNVDIREIELRYDLKFSDYFTRELKAFDAFINDGLLEWHDAKLAITESGQAALGSVCAAFHGNNNINY